MSEQRLVRSARERADYVEGLSNGLGLPEGHVARREVSLLRELADALEAHAGGDA
ncbi:hypothetical protein ACXR2W_00880 [Leucobacter sp. HY1908]